MTLLILITLIALPLTATAATAATSDDSYKDEVIRLTNLEREKAGLAPLQLLEGLSGIAQLRADETKVLFSHTRPNGEKWYTVFTNAKMEYTRVGENLAYGFTSPEKLVKAWMSSEGHKANILNPEFEYLGVGYAKNAAGRIYVSQLFFKPMPVIEPPVVPENVPVAGK